MKVVRGAPVFIHQQTGDWEQWLPVDGFPKFVVSTLGRVRRVKSSGNNGHAGMILKPSPNTTTKYPQVVLTNDEGLKLRVAVHRLVAIAFIPNPDSKPQVNHIDGNKANNWVSNLEWATASENSVHGLQLGLKKLPPSRKGTCKLSPDGVRYIRRLYKPGSPRQGGNVAQLAERFGISHSFVRSVAAGRNYKRVRDAAEIPVPTEDITK